MTPAAPRPNLPTPTAATRHLLWSEAPERVPLCRHVDGPIAVRSAPRNPATCQDQTIRPMAQMNARAVAVVVVGVAVSRDLRTIVDSRHRQLPRRPLERFAPAGRLTELAAQRLTFNDEAVPVIDSAFGDKPIRLLRPRPRHPHVSGCRVGGVGLRGC